MARRREKTYLEAQHRIDAVIRFFDIDDSWWSAGVRGDWAKYQAQASDENPTLFHALTRTRSGSVRNDCVQFVAEMPVPPVFGPDADAKARAEAFEKLLGLTWWLLVLEHARIAREGKNKTMGAAQRPFLAVRIASSQSWMHAIDDKVYQVIERPPPHPATVRLLSGATRTDSQKQRLSQWAHDDIRQTGRRGCDGEEYVCAVIRLVGLDRRTGLSEENPLRAEFLGPVLRQLGLEQWLDMRPAPAELSREERERLCVQVFVDFATSRTRLSGQPATLRGLLCELA